MKGKISKTEESVIRLRLVGLTRKQIAEVRFNSEKTIARHIRNVYLKSGVHNLMEFNNWCKTNAPELINE
jgi:DNA-binding NarL/FixJ family response regulator